MKDRPVIVIDTREQAELSFDGFETVRGTLGAGDYSLVGFEDKVAVERKGHGDAYQCVGAGRDRFVRCLERLSALDRAMIVIEPTIQRFCEPPNGSTVISPPQAMGSYISWMAKYRVPVVWCGSREIAARVVVRYLMAYLKHVHQAT